MRAGSGIFMWDAGERQTNRYGAFFLAKTTYGGEACDDARVDWAALQSLKGKRTKLWCVVTAARQSGHIGDLFLGIFPSKPDVGEFVLLGIGVLDIGKSFDGDPTIILRPADKREELWLDPRALYRLHDQTVELHVVQTEEACTPAPQLGAVDKGMKGAGDGAHQVKHVSDAELRRTRVAPKTTRLGDGLFMMTTEYGVGEDVKTRTDPDLYPPRDLDLDEDD